MHIARLLFIIVFFLDEIQELKHQVFKFWEVEKKLINDSKHSQFQEEEKNDEKKVK